MTTMEKTKITVEALIDAPVEKVWKIWTDPAHIIKWSTPTQEWHTPRAENDLRQDGKFLSRMEARDGSAGFDFEGTYNEIKEHELISYTIADGRAVTILFSIEEGKTKVTETFEAESVNPIEMQQGGWQAILDSFKKYVESNTDVSNQLQKIQFKIEINASADKVYRTMLDEKQYQEWTKEFNEGSHYIGSWDKGSKISFLGPDANGEMGGMLSRIKENIPHKFVSIEHYGMILKGKEITSGKEVEGWAGALENYTFREENGKTTVIVDLDAYDQFVSYFSATFPKALNRLKSICEN